MGNDFLNIYRIFVNVKYVTDKLHKRNLYVVNMRVAVLWQTKNTSILVKGG